MANMEGFQVNDHMGALGVPHRFPHTLPPTTPHVADPEYILLKVKQRHIKILSLFEQN